MTLNFQSFCQGVVTVVRPSTAAAISTPATAASGIIYARDGASRVLSGASRVPGSSNKGCVTASPALAARPVCILKSTLDGDFVDPLRR